MEVILEDGSMSVIHSPFYFVILHILCQTQLATMLLQIWIWRVLQQNTSGYFALFSAYIKNKSLLIAANAFLNMNLIPLGTLFRNIRPYYGIPIHPEKIKNFTWITKSKFNYLTVYVRSYFSLQKHSQHGSWAIQTTPSFVPLHGGSTARKFIPHWKLWY